MFRENIGIIFDIEPSKFIGDGAFYLNQDITEENNKTLTNIQLLSNMINKYNFDSKISSIIDEVTSNEKDKSISERKDEIDSFFNDNDGKILDLIIFADSGLRGTNKVIMEENSILYIKISDNIKLGFFINKTLAQYIFSDFE